MCSPSLAYLLGERSRGKAALCLTYWCACMQDEYRDVLEQQIAEKRHQPKSRGGLGSTRRNKRTLPGGRGNTDQPRRLTKVRLGRGGGCETKGGCL
jgi:hypothetical protein